MDSEFLENYPQVPAPTHPIVPFDHLFHIDIDKSNMELLLNLAWLLLAVPAYLLWRSTETHHDRRKFTTLQCLLALGGMLVLLFPVVSATDDMRTVRAEMEESHGSKRAIGHAHGEKTSRSNAQPALALTLPVFVTGVLGWFQVPVSQLSAPGAPATLPVSRGPPSSRLG